MLTSFVPRPGAMRYKTEEGEWMCANPGDLMFSTVTMFATEYWKGSDAGWTPIFEEDFYDSESGIGIEDPPD